MENYRYFTGHRYDIDISKKNRYIKCWYDTDTDISISAIYRRYFLYIDPLLMSMTFVLNMST